MRGRTAPNRPIVAGAMLVALLLVMLAAGPALGGGAANNYFYDVDMLSATAGWAVGQSGLDGEVYAFNGTAWAHQYEAPNRPIAGVFAVSTTDVWAVGLLGSIYHFNGTAWSPDPDSEVVTAADLTNIHGLGGSNVWAVGEGGAFVHFNGADWAIENTNPPTGGDFNDILAADALHQWAVGDAGRIYYRSGTQWVPHGQSGVVTTEDLIGISGYDNSHIWAAGAGGTILLYNGSSWSQVTSPTSDVLAGVYALDATHVWAAGWGDSPFQGHVYFYDGTTWSLIESSDDNNLFEVSAAGASCAWAVGGSGLAPVELDVAVGGAAPHIDSITPSVGGIGDPVVVAGTGFGAAQGTSTLAFNGALAAPTTWSDTQITCAVPQGAATGPVLVTTAQGTSNGVNFTVTTPNWYLAEGTTAWGFDTCISIENPNNQAVTAKVTYMTDTGPMARNDLQLPAMSQSTINPRDDIGNRDFSTRVICAEGRTIAVDRTMSWTGQGATSPEGHCSVGVPSPATTWYLPEGSSEWGFECWLLIQNPNAAAVCCDVTYMIEGEGPVTLKKDVPAGSRATFNMERDIGRKDASIKVVCASPVIPERAMYRNNRREGHDSIGTVTAASDCYLAEGTTAWGFIMYVLVQNPNTSDTTVTITYMTPAGAVQQDPFVMQGNSRKTIRVNDIESVKSTDLSTRVHGSLPIIAERAMYWDKGSGEACHDSIGMASPHSSFYLPDGQCSDGYETWTLVQNPNDTAVTVEVSYLTATGGGNVSFQSDIPANSRMTFNMSDRGIGGRAAVMVSSRTAGKNIMCERAMYWNSRGAGTDTIGGFSD